MWKNRNQGDKHDKHAEREALSSLGSSNHLLTGALRGQRGNPDTRSRSSNHAASGRFILPLLPPLSSIMPSTSAGGQETQSHRHQSQRSQSSRGQEQHARQTRRHEREHRDSDFTHRDRNQRTNTRSSGSGQASSSQQYRQSSSQFSGPSTGAGPSNLQSPQGILRRDPRPSRESHPEDQFIREDEGGFRCTLCENRNRAYLLIHQCRTHVTETHHMTLLRRGILRKWHKCPFCDFSSPIIKGLKQHMTRSHSPRGY